MSICLRRSPNFLRRDVLIGQQAAQGSHRRERPRDKLFQLEALYFLDALADRTYHYCLMNGTGLRAAPGTHPFEVSPPPRKGGTKASEFTARDEPAPCGLSNVENLEMAHP